MDFFKRRMAKAIAITTLILSAMFFVLACASGTSTAGTTQLQLDSSVVTGTLENGLTYFIQQNAEPQNRIMLRLVVNAGSNMEDDDQRGVAHFVEHMAFNGSEHFAENQLVSYFESIGMAFGPDVNAYTSFDETVYMLEIPADNPEMLATGLVVLRDWADGLLFDQVELDKERGVVTEEWRLGRGLSGRLQDAQIPFLLQDSRYAERLPIGTMDVISSVPRERVIDFYEKWYRPELMSVVVVGDADATYLEQMVRDTMSGIPASSERIERPQFSVPRQTDEAILVVRDSEQPYTLVQILEQTEYEAVTTEAQFRDSLVSYVASSILNERLAEISQGENSPWLDAAAFSQNITRNSSFNALGVIPLPGEFERGFTALLDELLRYKKFGAIQSELDRTVRNIAISTEQQWLNRDKKNSSQIASELVQYALTGDIVLAADELYDLYQKMLPSITLKEVNKVAKKFFSNRGVLLMAAVPQDVQDFPSDEALFQMWQKYKPKEPLAAYTEEDSGRELLELSHLKGSVVDKHQVEGTDVMSYTLSNGARLLTLQTDYRNKEVLFSAVSLGGMSLVEDGDVPSAKLAADFVAMSGLNGFSPMELQKKLAGKQVSISSFIGDYYEGLTGDAATSDLETLMQLIYLNFIAPDFTDAGWSNLMKSAETIAGTRSAKPENVFQDTLINLVYGDNIRKSAITPEFVSLLDRDAAQRIYRERFSNAADFTFVFVGDFDTATLLDLAETYIATLPADGSSSEKPVWREPDFPAGKPAATVHKGIEEKSRVFIAFGGNLPQGTPEQISTDEGLLDMLEFLLDIRLREVIREDKSGSYGVSVSATMITAPQRKFLVQISFGCEPGREQELADEVLEQVRRLQTELLDESYMTKLKETYRRDMEKSLRTNSYWLAAITDSVISGVPLRLASDVETIPALVSPQEMRRLATQYLNLDNYVVAMLVPEHKTY